MEIPSVFSAFEKLRSLLTREEKVKWLGIVGFAVLVSLLEIVTASAVVAFAQILHDPAVGQRYALYLGIRDTLSPGRTVFYGASFVGAIYLIKNLVVITEAFFQNFSIQKMCYDFKNKLLHRYAQADYGVYLTRNSFCGFQTISRDAEDLFTKGICSLACITSEGVIFISLVGMVIYINPALALIIFVFGGGFAFLVSRSLLPKFYCWGQRLQQNDVHSGRNLMQFFYAFKDIILLGKRESFVGAYQVYAKQRSKVQAIQASTHVIPRVSIETFFVALFILAVFYLCAEHESPVQMVGLLGGYLYAGFRLMPSLNRIIYQFGNFKSTIPAIERIYKEYATVATHQNYDDIPTFAFKDSLVFQDVSFKYLSTDVYALSNVNLVIPKGECLGIIGETGSGKSTLVDLLLGLLRPSVGSIWVDGRYSVHCVQWHSHIGYVPQTVYLVDDTIEANIAFGEENIDGNRLDQAIDAAQLRKLVSSLPKGAQTVVGERGVRLSGGERQRIAIARALYRNPEVLIFDEATSALDNATETRLMETIRAVSRDRTVIMIAHRLTTLKDCDRVMRMDQGRIVAYDDPRSLQKKI